MTIGVLQLELEVIDAMSLKDKRRVVLSLKDRIAHGHNVSIAEVGALGRLSPLPCFALTVRPTFMLPGSPPNFASGSSDNFSASFAPVALLVTTTEQLLECNFHFPKRRWRIKEMSNERGIRDTPD